MCARLYFLQECFLTERSSALLDLHSNASAEKIVHKAHL